MKSVILISIDNLRADAISPENTPNWLRLAGEGRLYDETIVQAPFTIPSHASLLMELYSARRQLRSFAGQKLNRRHKPCSRNFAGEGIT